MLIACSQLVVPASLPHETGKTNDVSKIIEGVAVRPLLGTIPNDFIPHAPASTGPNHAIGFPAWLTEAYHPKLEKAEKPPKSVDPKGDAPAGEGATVPKRL